MGIEMHVKNDTVLLILKISGTGAVYLVAQPVLPQALFGGCRGPGAARGCPYTLNVTISVHLVPAGRPKGLLA
jgi:hypothetical protein